MNFGACEHPCALLLHKSVRRCSYALETWLQQTKTHLLQDGPAGGPVKTPDKKRRSPKDPRQKEDRREKNDKTKF